MTNYKQYLSPDGGERITIMYDEDPLSPREWDNIGTMICFHNRYALGDNHDFKDPGEVRHSEYFDESKYFRFPLFLRDHSGLRMRIGSFGARFEWDSGRVGWIFIPIQIDSAYVNDGANTERTVDLAHGIASSEVDVYDQYLSGDVYGAELEISKHCEHCGHAEWKSKDSCWGFFGTDSVMEFAKELGLTDEWKEVE